MSHSQTLSNPTGEDGLRRGPMQPALHDDMMARVLDPANMRRAWKRVKANRGAPGMDAMRIEDFAAFARSHWAEIRQQLEGGTYPPQPVRRVSIPKPGGGERLLGIPTVVDRVIQQAMAQVLTPIFDPGFSASSFGFRPGRSAHGALRQVQGHIGAGSASRCSSAKSRTTASSRWCGRPRAWWTAMPGPTSCRSRSRSLPTGPRPSCAATSTPRPRSVRARSTDPT